MRLTRALLLVVATLLALPAAAQTASDMQILAEKIRADKKLVVAANMQLTEEEAKGFWPVYDAYQADMQKVNQRMAAGIKTYATAYSKGGLSDELAKKLLNEMIAIEDAEVKLKRTYVPKLEKAIPGVKVARYMQIESKIRAVIRYELATQIPLVQ
jgi:hypothetical protein